ncbi:hypothetical protein IF2G_04438 [Cordyceps javanica]|nr:hypothetical protein IF2G_04438 [Cordyceps javanica]
MTDPCKKTPAMMPSWNKAAAAPAQLFFFFGPGLPVISTCLLGDDDTGRNISKTDRETDLGGKREREKRERSKRGEREQVQLDPHQGHDSGNDDKRPTCGIENTDRVDGRGATWP